MQRRELIKTAGLGGIAASLIGSEAMATICCDEPPAMNPAAEAFADLQMTLDVMEKSFASEEWNLTNDKDFAEARRLLLHALLHGIQTRLEADPARPFFTSFIDRHKKMLGDNPDARYYSAVISDQHSYRIRGNLAGATYTSFTLEIESGEGGIGSTLNDSEFEIDANGDYEIIVSKEKVAGNWMPMSAGVGSITTRHYYEREVSINNDHLHHVPITIENLDAVPPRSAPAVADIASGIRRVTEFLHQAVVPLKPQPGLDWVSRVPNQFNPIVKDDSNESVTFAAKDNVYAMAPFVLAPNQALVIRGRFPKCRFANVVLWNRFMQTFNYEERTVSLNRKQTVQDEQGNFEMVLAHKDPGRPNWLDTEGRAFGLMFWRFQLAEEEIQSLETEVIELG